MNPTRLYKLYRKIVKKKLDKIFAIKIKSYRIIVLLIKTTNKQYEKENK